MGDRVFVVLKHVEATSMRDVVTVAAVKTAMFDAEHEQGALNASAPADTYYTIQPCEVTGYKCLHTGCGGSVDTLCCGSCRST